MPDDENWCCEEFRSAFDVTFANPVDGAFDWLLYGTDYESVAAGLPELRYWPIRFCPFCGQRLNPARSVSARDRREFGKVSPSQKD